MTGHAHIFRLYGTKCTSRLSKILAFLEFPCWHELFHCSLLFPWVLLLVFEKKLHLDFGKFLEVLEGRLALAGCLWDTKLSANSGKLENHILHKAKACRHAPEQWHGLGTHEHKDKIINWRRLCKKGISTEFDSDFRSRSESAEIWHADSSDVYTSTSEWCHPDAIPKTLFEFHPFKLCTTLYSFHKIPWIWKLCLVLSSGCFNC